MLWMRLFFISCLAFAPMGNANAQSGSDLLDLINANVKDRANGALAIMGLSVVPNETASTLSVDTGNPDDARFWASQLGGAFTVSDEVPVYLEGFLGVARYDPTFVFSAGGEKSRVPAKWTTFSGTAGVGWDFRIAEELVLRPIANFSLGHIESDAALLGRVIEEETGVELKFLDDGRLSAYGYGGSLMLDWERYRPEYEIDVELRYTHIRLESFGGSTDSIEGQADAITLGLWSRLRVPTGWTAFDGPVRGVGEFSAGRFLGDQEKVLDSLYLLQVGAGFELDLAEVSWLPLERARVMGRYVFGEGDVDGFSVGIGLTF
jgi:hypothetical protein